MARTQIENKPPVTQLGWRVYTPGLLKEIAQNPECSTLNIPIKIFRQLLAQVAERATVLNDPRLNGLMMRLCLYSVADPKSADYDPEVVRKYLGE